MNSVQAVMTVREVSTALHVTHQTVYKLIEDGKLKAFRLRGDTGPFRVYKESLDGYIGAAEDTPFMLILKEVFSAEEDLLYIRLLELLYRDGCSRIEAGETMDTTPDAIYRWVVSALSVLSPVVKEQLKYTDIQDDKFALRVISHIFLAQT